MSPFQLPRGSRLAGDEDGRSPCTQLVTVLSELTQEERDEHLLAHAVSCTDAPWTFVLCGFCKRLRREHFKRALTTKDARWLYWLDGEAHADRPPLGEDEANEGLVTCAFIVLPNDVVWAEIREGGALEGAPRAVAALEASQSGPVFWWFNTEELRWLGDQEWSKHRSAPSQNAEPNTAG